MAFQYPTSGERLFPVMNTLQQWGFQDFFLPFLVFFTLMFAVLQKVALFTKKKKVGSDDKIVPDRAINGFISAAIAGMIVVPHVLRLYPLNRDPVELMMNFLPTSTIAFVVLIFGLLFIGIVSTPEALKEGSAIRVVVGLVAAAIVLLSFLKNIFPAIFPEWLTIDPTTQAVAIVVAVMAGVIWFIAGDDTPGKPAHTRLLETFGKGV